MPCASEWWDELQAEATTAAAAALLASIALTALYRLLPRVRRTPGWLVQRAAIADALVSAAFVALPPSKSHSDKAATALILLISFFEMAANLWRLLMFVDLLLIYRNPFARRGALRKAYPFGVLVLSAAATATTYFLAGPAHPPYCPCLAGDTASAAHLRVLLTGMIVAPFALFVLLGLALWVLVRLLLASALRSARLAGHAPSISYLARQRVMRHGSAYMVLHGSQLAAGLVLLGAFCGGEQTDPLTQRSVRGVLKLLLTARPVFSFVGWLVINDVVHLVFGCCSLTKPFAPTPAAAAAGEGPVPATAESSRRDSIVSAVSAQHGTGGTAARRRGGGSGGLFSNAARRIEAEQGIVEAGFKEELRFELMHDVAVGVGELAQLELRAALFEQQALKADGAEPGGRGGDPLRSSIDLGEFGMRASAIRGEEAQVVAAAAEADAAMMRPAQLRLPREREPRRLSDRRQNFRGTRGSPGSSLRSPLIPGGAAGTAPSTPLPKGDACSLGRWRLGSAGASRGQASVGPLVSPLCACLPSGGTATISTARSAASPLGAVSSTASSSAGGSSPLDWSTLSFRSPLYAAAAGDVSTPRSGAVSRSASEGALGSALLPAERPHPPSLDVYHYAPERFRAIRASFGVGAATYARAFPDDLSVLGTQWRQRLKESVSEGASGSFFYRVLQRASDSSAITSRCIIKQITRSEKRMLMAMLPAYEAHVAQRGGRSFIQYFGCHSMSLHWRFSGKVYFVVMRNVLPAGSWLVFDLKGATANRRALASSFLSSLDSVAAVRGGGGAAYGTLRDWEWLDIAMAVDVSPADKEELADTLQADAAFLAEQGSLDYSLLIGVHRLPAQLEGAARDERIAELVAHGGFASADRQKIYFFGIIDVLERYRLRWKVQRAVLTLGYALMLRARDADGISALPPAEYADRFTTFVLHNVLQTGARRDAIERAAAKLADEEQSATTELPGRGLWCRCCRDDERARARAAAIGLPRWGHLWRRRRRGLVQDRIEVEREDHLRRIHELEEALTRAQAGGGGSSSAAADTARDEETGHSVRF